MEKWFKDIFKKVAEKPVLKTRNIQVSLKSMAQYISQENEDGSYDILCRIQKSTMGGIRFFEQVEASALPYKEMRQKMEELEISLRDRFMTFKRDVASKFAPFEVIRSIDEFNSVRLPKDHYTRFPLNKPIKIKEKSLIRALLRR